MYDQENFEFPTNIKQIGSIPDEGLKIYAEDYVCTYLQQYANSSGNTEKIALLVGRYFVIDKQEVLFISGAIQGKYSKFEANMEGFTDRTWEYAQEQMDLYFKGLEIVGWVYIQPNYGVFLNPNYVDFHMQNFTKPYHTLFVMDPVEKTNSFYIWNEALDDLAEAKGYFIYFDRNEGMHEYMLDNRIIKLKVQEEPGGHFRGAEKTDKIIKSRRQETQKTRSEHRKLVNMLVSLSGVLLLVCFVMGIGLIQNEGRITALEKELSQIDSSYKNLLFQIKTDNVENVFASQEMEDSELSKEGEANLNETEDITGEAAEKEYPDTTPTPEPPPEPPRTEARAPAADTIPDTYMVQEGDTLSYISLKVYGTSSMVTKIMEENSLSDPDKIYFGKVLKLPR